MTVSTAGTANPKKTDRDSPRRVVVIGGGLAGMAAAIKLADRGQTVTLIETRKRLGGRATSFEDNNSGQTVDNCQHVLMGCCTNLKDLYERLGVLDLIEWHRKLNFVDGQGHIDVLQSGVLPAPMHMSTSMLGFKSLTLGEKISIARAMLKMMRLGQSGRQRLHEISFADWLSKQRQPIGALKKFWLHIVVSALNDLPEKVAADYAIQVFQDGFLHNKDAYVVGIPRVPLVRLYDAAREAIEQSGGKVLLGAGAESLVFDQDQGRVTTLKLTDGSEIQADVFVSALPFDRLDKVCDESMRKFDDRLAHLDQFKVSPIIGIHLWFKADENPSPSSAKPVMNLPHMVLTESPLQWVFNKGVGPCEEAGCSAQHLHGVISAAYQLVDQKSDSIIEMAVGEIQKALPGAKDRQPVHARVIKEKRATFSACPGIDKIRPQARGAIENLFLAGDFCRSGWPATMEGAVRSGYLAAGAILQKTGLAGQVEQIDQALVADLPSSLLYSLVSRR
jgi:squalene-associated FAD-dependent desaturase